MKQQQPPILEVSHLSFRYGNSSVWGDVALALSSGQLGVLLGANGAGKSTLLRCLAGWAPPDKGEIRFRGAALRGADRSFRRRLILVNDTPPFYDDLTAAEHVRFVLRANCREDREVAAGSLLERFGLAGHVTAYPSSFSRGMRYKLALAMALALEPDLLLLDEPFGPLDPISAGAMLKVHGLEAALVDNSVMRIGALETTDARSFTMKVAGPTALLISKIIKLSERVAAGALERGRPDRVKPKDALDVLRLLQAIPSSWLAEGFAGLLEDETAGPVTSEALGSLPGLFGNAGSPGSQLAAEAAAPEPPDVIAASCAALCREVLDALHALGIDT